MQATGNIFTTTLHQWKKIEDFQRGKREVENIIRFSFEARVLAVMIKLAYNFIMSCYVITTELSQLMKSRHNNISFS